MLLSYGLWATWSMRLNLNMAIPCMGTLDWNASMQSILFSASFFTTCLTVVFAGYLTDRFGPKITFLGATILFVFVSLLSPITANQSFYGFFILRLLMGLCDGFLLPCINSFVTRWYPLNEKSTMVAVTSSGTQLAAGGSALISSFLCLSIFKWPSIFYFFAINGCIWCFISYFLVTDSPQENRLMSRGEKDYLLKEVSTVKNISKHHSVPWKEISWSRPVLACNICSMTSNFIQNLNQSFLPTYFKEVLLLSMKKNGFITMIPFFAELTSKISMGILSDYLKREKEINATKLSKIFQTISSFGSAIGVLLLATIPTSEKPYLSIPFLLMTGFCFSCQTPGYVVSQVTIAPPYTGIITAKSQIMGNLGNLGAPLLLTFLNHFVNFPFSNH
ncbi:unnamed protein product, partial [Mesorhabditis belari]|uniref:Major facilitator superfamily (MFS) profile domain-containing protein n=1 Tax=Mesorhabditis belari TaxID=2138241 RepID=A0AAF3FMT2_9BILA